MAWKTTKDGRHFNTDWINEDNTKKENKWDYPGIAEEIDKIQDRIKNFKTLEREGRKAYIKTLDVSSTLKAVKGQLGVIEAEIHSEGENNHLLTYRRKLRQFERKLKSGKFSD